MFCTLQKSLVHRVILIGKLKENADRNDVGSKLISFKQSICLPGIMLKIVNLINRFFSSKFESYDIEILFFKF